MPSLTKLCCALVAALSLTTILGIAADAQSTTDPGQFIISEFRLRGANGVNDEFIELYNNTDSDIAVSATDASSGWAVVASDGVTRAVIPNGQLIPARGHLLVVNSTGYSLANYGGTNAAAGDLSYTQNIPDNGGVALFSTANAANFNTANLLDAAGYASAPQLYREGAGLSISGAEISISLEDSLVRKFNFSTGHPTDSGDNLADFIGVSTTGTNVAGSQTLGAPGPENLASPVERNSTSVGGFLLDATKTVSQSPNRVRDLTSDPANNSTNGTLSIRRRFVNNTGQAVTRLRFRLIALTSFPAPTGVADLRVRTSPNVTVSDITDPATCPGGVTPCTVTVFGTTLEEAPPHQPSGGALNSSLSADSVVTLATPLTNGQSVNVQFLLGVQQAGTFTFFIQIEALTQTTFPSLSGNIRRWDKSASAGLRKPRSARAR